MALLRGWQKAAGPVRRALARVACVVTIMGLGLAVSAVGPRPEPAAVPEGLARGEWSQIRAALLEDRHRVEAHEAGGLVAANPRNGFEARFDEAGFALSSSAGDWQLPVRFAGHGWRGSALIPAEAANPVADGHRVSFQRGEVTEWYLNKPTGVEQGFTIARAPAGQGHRLDVALDIGGGFIARPDGRDARLIQAATGTEIDYDHLVVTDARGRTLKSRMEVSDHRIVLSVDTRGASFPIVVDPTFTQQAKLLASDKADSDSFGYSVAISGDTVVVGAYLEDDGGTSNNGAAYVFTRSGWVWSQQQKLLASDKAMSDLFGSSVAISGETVVVGAYGKDDNGLTDNGAAYVFTRSDGVWSQQQKLLASDKAAGDLFGSSVAISGDTVVVGAYGKSDGGTSHQGSAYVFTRSDGVWSEQAKLLASDKADNDYFGYSVAIWGDTVAVGAYFEDSSGLTNNGAAYVFTLSDGAWSQQQKLLASDKADSDYFGQSVAISGETVVVGASGEDDSGTSDNGAAYVFAVEAPPPAPIPTLSEWAMILLGVMLAGAAGRVIHRRRLEA